MATETSEQEKLFLRDLNSAMSRIDCRVVESSIDGISTLYVAVNIYDPSFIERGTELLSGCFLAVYRRGEIIAQATFDDATATIELNTADMGAFELTPYFTLGIDALDGVITSPYMLAEVLRLFDDLATSLTPTGPIDRRYVTYARQLRAQLLDGPNYTTETRS